MLLRLRADGEVLEFHHDRRFGVLPRTEEQILNPRLLAGLEAAGEELAQVDADIVPAAVVEPLRVEVGQRPVGLFVTHEVYGPPGLAIVFMLQEEGQRLAGRGADTETQQRRQRQIDRVAPKPDGIKPRIAMAANLHARGGPAFATDANDVGLAVAAVPVRLAGEVEADYEVGLLSPTADGHVTDGSLERVGRRGPVVLPDAERPLAGRDAQGPGGSGGPPVDGEGGFRTVVVPTDGVPAAGVDFRAAEVAVGGAENQTPAEDLEEPAVELPLAM